MESAVSTHELPTNTSDDVEKKDWTEAFAAESQDAFSDAFTENVAFEATLLPGRLEGRDVVGKVMGTMSEIYETLIFEHEAVNGPRTYVEWKATALGGVKFAGVTVLTRADDGRIEQVAIHHRPLSAGIKLYEHASELLDGVVDVSNLPDIA